MVSRKQRLNGRAILATVAHHAYQQNWSRRRATRVARMAIMCALTESNLLIYANGNIQESLNLPHDAVGWDHASVGLFQQQTPMWGSVRSCMEASSSTLKFLNAAHSKGMDTLGGPPLWQRCQKIQVSAYDGYARDANNWSSVMGGNYANNRGRAWRFMIINWPSIYRVRARR